MYVYSRWPEVGNTCHIPQLVRAHMKYYVSIEMASNRESRMHFMAELCVQGYQMRATGCDHTLLVVPM